MLKNFPPKFYFIFSEHPENKYHKNRMIAGLRVALTLLMEEYDINVLLLQKSVAIATNNPPNNPNDKNDDDVNFTPYELLEGLITFGANIMTCKSSLTMVGMEEKDLIEGVEMYTLHTAMMKMVDCDKILTF